MTMSLKIVLLIWSLMALCSVAEVSFVTQEQFQEFVAKFQQQETINLQQATINQQLASKVEELDQSLKELQSFCKYETQPGFAGHFQHNITIDERVTILETEMGYVLQELSEIETDVDFLFDEQFLQDQRILALEQDTDQLDDHIEDLETMTLTLENRIDILEEDGGGNDNSSVHELQVRVTELEEVTGEQEARIIDNTQSIEELKSNVTQSLDMRVTALEVDLAEQEGWIAANTQSIAELQSTDLDLDDRVSALEIGGNGTANNDTVAFHVVLTSYSTISAETPVPFNLILEDTNHSLDSSTGIFTVPPGGDGLYFFSTYLLVDDGEWGVFGIKKNGDLICTAREDENSNSGSDTPQATCSGVASLIEGDEVQVIYGFGTDSTPLYVTTGYYFSGFTGFRL